MVIDISHQHYFPAPTDPKLDQIIALLEYIKYKQERDMSALDDAISDLSTKVTALTAVDESAIALIGGIAAQVAAAVQAAQTAGATPEQLAAMSELSAKLDTETTSLGQAVSANTPTP